MYEITMLDKAIIRKRFKHPVFSMLLITRSAKIDQMNAHRYVIYEGIPSSTYTYRSISNPTKPNHNYILLFWNPTRA